MVNFTIVDNQPYFNQNGKWYSCEVKEDGIHKGDEANIIPEKYYSLLEINAKFKPKTSMDSLRLEIDVLMNRIKELEAEKEALLTENKKLAENKKSKDETK